MPSDCPRYTGKVLGAKGNGFFMVKIDDDLTILCQLSGKMRTNNIKVVEGDLVDVEVDPFDMSKGRIVYRRKS